MSILFSFDTEIYPIQAGILAPPLVCASIAQEAPGSERLLSAAQTRTWFRETLRKPDVQLTGTNLAYDLGIMCEGDPRLVDAVFSAAEADRVHDVTIREALLDIAQGLHGVDPETGHPLGDDEGARYPLALLVRRHLALDISADKHAPDA
ncbi:hypothetical protein ACJ2CR_29465 [Myxococcus faecalis]|uniref:hypothetical protein n=1 Tax=Myxococcus faecalis TaxID=3115646 RepID=UPI0038D24C01